MTAFEDEPAMCCKLGGVKEKSEPYPLKGEEAIGTLSVRTTELSYT